MGKFETLNTIVGNLQIKESTLTLFGLDELMERGREYTELEEEPPPIFQNHPEIVMEDGDDSFCSVFAENDTMQSIDTQITTPDTLATKLKSDGDILTSEFDNELLEPMLTSQGWEEEVSTKL